ncbi:MAG: hypothetical protein L0Z51_08055 [Candidatus Latescibacteria bacterium]|nr:hypothetical protein [Candidatus Latescibacterota bacterium]
MVKPVVTPLALFVLIASFAVGWRGPSASTPEGLVAPINMTLADQTLYISDTQTGVHVYDVADPSAPRPVAAIPMTGNRGTAVKDDILYASNYRSLVVYRREGDTFTLVTELEPTYDPWHEGGGTPKFKGGTEGYYYNCSCGTSSDQISGAPTPTSGGSSYATFALIDDCLYRVGNFQLVVYDVGTPEAPKEIARKDVGWTIETIYPTNQYLFLGGTQGMSIYDRSNPAAPRFIGSFTHVRACDPVVVSETTAYVTLRGGNGCGQTRDLLLTVNIADPSQPVVVAEKELATPFGLAVRDPFLYVSTGGSGYALLDVTDPKAPAPLVAWPGWPTRDFLWSNDVLFVLGLDDVRIYDVTDPKAPVLLATIENDPS